MKIVGIISSTFSPYFKEGFSLHGLPILLTKARNEGHRAIMYDENISKISLNLIKEEAVRADLIIFSCMTAAYNRTVLILNWIKKDLGLKTPTAIGGVHVTFETEKALDDGFDFVFRGEGELTFPKFLKIMESRGDFSQVPSLCWKKDGEKIYNPLPTVLPDLDRDSPFPDFLDTNLFPQWQKKRMMVVETSRSCPYNCEFCSVHPMFGKYRQRKDLRAVVKEIKRVEPRSVLVVDDCWASHNNTERAKEFMRLELSMLPKIPRLFCQIRSDAFRDEELQLLAKRVKLVWAGVGYETKNPEALKEAKKKQTVESIEEDIAIGKKTGLASVIHPFLIAGFDSDNKYTALETVRWFKRLPNPAQIAVLTPFPGTALRERLKKENRLLPEAYNPELCDGTHAVFIPLKMTAAELQESAEKAGREVAPLWRNVYLTIKAPLGWTKDWLTEVRSDERLIKNFKRAFLHWLAWRIYREMRQRNKGYREYLERLRPKRK